MVILNMMFYRMYLDLWTNTHRDISTCMFTHWQKNIFGSPLRTLRLSLKIPAKCSSVQYVSLNITCYFRERSINGLNCLQKHTKCTKMTPEYALTTRAFPVFSTSQCPVFSQVYHSIPGMELTASTSINLPWVSLLLDPMEILCLCPNWLRHGLFAPFPSRPWSSCGTAQLSASPAHSGQVTGIPALATKLGHLKSQEDWMSQRRSTLSRTLVPLPFHCSPI